MESGSFDPSTPLDAPAVRTGGNLVLAILAGLAAALVGAALWAALVSVTNIKIGFAAVGIGFLVGWAMRGVGQGHSPVYGYAAAVLALLGCLAGDLFTDCIFRAQSLSQPVLDFISITSLGR